VGETMSRPSGIVPIPARVDPRTGIQMAWIAGMSLADLTRAWLANDAARSKKLLHEMNLTNARYWGSE
jgi:hypothetical protein